ncbi:MAG TPA: hypothetical protein QGG77_03615, partial [Prochlorococcaceae cyanobacterium Gl_MAG_24]|nr:hypothetical protein [Prochlorococcaceae cyanobacterium Gl_MAG_24]
EEDRWLHDAELWMDAQLDRDLKAQLVSTEEADKETQLNIAEETDKEAQLDTAEAVQLAIEPNLDDL